jgi:hypothetical protein
MMSDTERPNEVDSDVEAHGLKEVMGVGLAAAALAGAAAPAKAVAAEGYAGAEVVALDIRALDPSAEYGLRELEAAGYEVSFAELEKSGWKVRLDELEAIGFKCSLDELDKAGMKQAVETPEGIVWTLALKWGADAELDTALDSVDQATQYRLSEFAQLGYDINTRELEAAGFIIDWRELDELGAKMSWHDSVGFKRAPDASEIGIKLGVDEELDGMILAWPSKSTGTSLG